MSKSKKRFDHAMIRAISDTRTITEVLWEQGEDGLEFVTATQDNETVLLFFKRPVKLGAVRK